MRRQIKTMLCAFLSLALLSAGQSRAQAITHVIHISIDGLRPDGITALGPSNAPNFYRLRREGAFTDNARTDYDITVTLPNHICQVTGRGVDGSTGHNWFDNGDPAPGDTLASNKGSYVAGVFDVAHDNGLRTGAYVSKSKFSLFATSWDGVNGAPDVTGPDNGRNKIDVYVYDEDTAALVSTFVADMAAQPFHYTFIHIRDLDSTGHAWGWDPTPGSEYSEAVKIVDGYLGSIFSLITTNPVLAGHTAIILTADHGGLGYDHGNPTVREDYTIPFYNWGPGVMPGADLYILNQTTRLDPATGRPDYSAPIQPIRNGEAANVSLKLLGLGPVPGSTIDAAQNLAVTVTPLPAFEVTVEGTNAVLSFSTISNLLYDVQTMNYGPWVNLVTNVVGQGQATNLTVSPAIYSQQYFRLKLHF